MKNKDCQKLNSLIEEEKKCIVKWVFAVKKKRKIW